MVEPLIIYAIIFFGLGFVAGLIVSMLFSTVRSNKAESQARNKSLPEVPLPLEKPTSTRITDSTPSAEPERVAPDFIGENVPEPGSRLSQPAKQPLQEKPDLVGSFLRGVQSTTLKEKPKSLSMAAEIEEILQEKLLESPLAGRSIHLREQKDFGLLVIVDRESYSGIEAVPDESVRNFIREAVAEWQRRASQV